MTELVYVRDVSLFSGGGGHYFFLGGRVIIFFASCLGKGHKFFQGFLGEGHDFLNCLSAFLHHENARNVVQGISKFLKFSRGSMPPDRPTSFYLHFQHAPPLSPSRPPQKNPGYAPETARISQVYQQHSIKVSYIDKKAPSLKLSKFLF